MFLNVRNIYADFFKIMENMVFAVAEHLGLWYFFLNKKD